jgi:spore coat polysaccharide biosynthesis protein SpsF
MKTAILIPVRLGSTRLPGKMALRINGQTVVEHLIRRMQQSQMSDLVVLCTTTGVKDDLLAEIAETARVPVFRGSEEDVPERLLGAADQFGVDFFVVAEGDELFADWECADQIFRHHESSGADFISLDGLPIGAYLIGIKTDALRQVCARKAPGNTDGWGRYFTQTNWFQVESLSVNQSIRRPEFRFTLDYPEDFALAEAVYRKLSGVQEPSLREVLALMDAEPELAEINRNRVLEYEQHAMAYPPLQFRDEGNLT